MTLQELTSDSIAQVRDGVARFADRTPIHRSDGLSERSGGEIGLKLESIQPTGSFKIRGAAAKLTSLPSDILDRGVITASTGNHGRAVAYVARSMGTTATICLSDNVPVGKVESLRSLGCDVDIGGSSQDAAFERATAISARPDGPTLVHSILDTTVLAGQGTCGLEIAEQAPDTRLVVVPVSGGGLIAGVATGVRSLLPDARVVGVSMDRGAVMHASIAAGHPVQLPEVASLADSLQGGIGLDNTTTFPVIQELVDSIVLVTEVEIAAGMAYALHEHRLVLEGAGAVGIAAILAGTIEVPDDGHTIVVCSGSNAEIKTIAALASGRTDAMMTS